MKHGETVAKRRQDPFRDGDENLEAVGSHRVGNIKFTNRGNNTNRKYKSEHGDVMIP